MIEKQGDPSGLQIIMLIEEMVRKGVDYVVVRCGLGPEEAAQEIEYAAAPLEDTDMCAQLMKRRFEEAVAAMGESGQAEWVVRPPQFRSLLLDTSQATEYFALV